MKKKNIITLAIMVVLAIVVLGSFVGCGKKAESSTPSTTTTTETKVEEPVVEAKAEEPVAEPAVEQQPVVEETATEPVAETEVKVEEPAVEEPATEPATEPVVEEPVVEPEQPAVEEPVVEEPVAEAAVVYVPVENKYVLYGYELTVVADKGKATITYPASVISEEDIEAAAVAAFTAYSAAYDLSNVYYSVEDGVLTVYYPEEWGMEELALAEKLVMAELPAYVEAVVASYVAKAEPVAEAPVAEPAVEETATEPVAEEPAVEQPVVEQTKSYARTINLYGYEASIKAEDNLVEITYPDFITYEEIEAAAKVAYEAFPQYLEGSALYVDSSVGAAVLVLAAIPSEADFNYAVDLVETALPVYVASLFQQPAVEEVTEVVEVAKEEEPVVEEPAVEEPATEPATEPVVEEPVVEPEQPAVEEPVVEEPVAEAAVVYVPVENKYVLYGYELTVVADKGKATITYPASVISEEDIEAAAVAAFTAYSAAYDLSNVYYSVEDGVLTVYYPEEWGMEELALAEKLVMAELPAYVEAVVASYVAKAEPVAEAPVAEPAVEETATEPVAEEPAVEQPVVEQTKSYARTINLYGYEASIKAEDNLVEITYPDFITYEEIEAAAKVAYEAFPQYLEGSALYVDSSVGAAVLVLAAIPSEADFNYAVDLVETALPVYVASLFQQPAVEEVTEVVEVAKEEEPVVEEPATEPVVEEPVVEEVAVTYVPVELKYTLYGYELSVVADKGKATITYPASVISEEDIDAAAIAAYEAYGSVYDLSAVYFSAEDGVLTVYYPEEWGVEELYTAEAVLLAELPAYVESVVASYAAKAEPVEEAVVAKAEEPVAEAPEAEPAVEEPVAEEPVVEQPVAEPEQPEVEVIEVVEVAKAAEEKKNSVALAFVPSWNLGGGDISAKGFNWAIGARYEYNINKQLSVGGKLAYNFKFNYAQINAFASYAVVELEKSNVYALASVGADYSFMAGKLGFSVELGAGFEYSITDNISAFAELCGQFSTIRKFDVTGNVGVKYSF